MTDAKHTDQPLIGPAHRILPEAERAAKRIVKKLRGLTEKSSWSVEKETAWLSLARIITLEIEGASAKPVEGVQELKEILKEWRFSSCGRLLYNMYPQYKEHVDDYRNLLEKLGVKFDD